MKFNRLAIVIGALLLVASLSSAVLAVPTGCRTTGLFNVNPPGTVQPTAGATDVIAAVFAVKDNAWADPTAPYANCPGGGIDGLPTYLTRVHIYAPGATGVSTVKLYVDANLDGGLNVGDALLASVSGAALATTGVDITFSPIIPISAGSAWNGIIALDFIGTPTIPFNVQATFYADDYPPLATIPWFESRSSDFGTAPGPVACPPTNCIWAVPQTPTNPITSNITVAPGAVAQTFQGMNNGSCNFENTITPVVIQNSPATRGGATTVTAGAIEAFLGHICAAEGGYCGGPGVPQLYGSFLPGGGFAIAGGLASFPFVPNIGGADGCATTVKQVRVRLSGPVAPHVTAVTMWVDADLNGILFGANDLAFVATPVNNIATFGSLTPGFLLGGVPWPAGANPPTNPGAGPVLVTFLVNIGPGAPTGTLTADVVFDVGDDAIVGVPSSNMATNQPITIGTINVTGGGPAAFAAISPASFAAGFSGAATVSLTGATFMAGSAVTCGSGVTFVGTPMAGATSVAGTLNVPATATGSVSCQVTNTSAGTLNFSFTITAPARREGDGDGDGDADRYDYILLRNYLRGRATCDATCQAALDIATPCGVLDRNDLRAFAQYLRNQRRGIPTTSACDAGQVIGASLSTMLVSQLEPLALSKVAASVGRNEIRFSAEGKGIEMIRVQVFDLSGRGIFDSGLVGGNELRWSSGNLANGVYLYVVTAEGFGQAMRSEIKKLVILR